jgi:hypothetical protein
MVTHTQRKQKKKKPKQTIKGKRNKRNTHFLPPGKHQRIPKGQSKVDNLEKLTA